MTKILVQAFLREPFVMKKGLFIWQLHRELTSSGEGSPGYGTWASIVSTDDLINCTVRRSYKHGRVLPSVSIVLVRRICCTPARFFIVFLLKYGGNPRLGAPEGAKKAASPSHLCASSPHRQREVGQLTRREYVLGSVHGDWLWMNFFP